MVAAQQATLKRRVVLLVSLSALILMVVGTFLNIWLGRVTLKTVKDQFNQEQLVAARAIKYWIERQIRFLEKELRLAGKNIDGTALEPEAIYPVLKPCFDRVVELGVAKIELSDQRRGLKYTVYPYRTQVDTSVDATPVVEPGGGEQDGGQRIFISQPVGDGPGMDLNLSITLDHALFDRLSFQLNLPRFLTPFLNSIRSGKTGYAWIIDSQGRFLYHPQPAFIGQSAFKARSSREPGISHHLIETIQRESMLAGMEGTGFYHSGWHLGITGKIEKLIAFSPVVISETPPQFWSVAVVAPVFEIEDALHTTVRWQTILQALVMLVIVAAAGIILWFEIRWSNRLEKTVQARTVALKRSEENYRSLVESAEDFIYTVDQNGRLLSINSFTAAWFGSRSEELIGLGVDHLFPREIAQRQLSIVQTVFATGKSIRDEFELKVGHSETWISANFMPLKSDTGRMTAVLCIARDITENKKLERQLVNTEKLASLGTLAAGVAHEINNPLGVMLGFCDLLVRKKEPGTQEYEDLKVIERQGLLCKQVVENLLSFARVGREVSRATDLNDCLQEIIKVVRHSLKMKAIDLQIDLAENLPMVAGDHRQLQQVFLNLINNGAAAMPEGGVLTIQTDWSADGKKVAARIQDQGSGIAPEIMDHIFEPFFTTKLEGQGTGLGLFVSYGIINKFGGTIACESQTHTTGSGPRGTTFTVVLPTSMEQ